MARYRPNVAFILRNASGEILVGRRSDHPECWQFPQGGVKPGETPEDALAREVKEEIGLVRDAYRVLTRRGPYRYRFSDGFAKGGFDGQEQEYFLAETVAPDTTITLAAEGEFSAVRWLPPAEFRLSWLPPMKRPVYRAVFRDFFAMDPRE